MHQQKRQSNENFEVHKFIISTLCPNSFVCYATFLSFWPNNWQIQHRNVSQCRNCSIERTKSCHAMQCNALRNIWENIFIRKKFICLQIYPIKIQYIIFILFSLVFSALRLRIIMIKSLISNVSFQKQWTNFCNWLCKLKNVAR